MTGQDGKQYPAARPKPAAKPVTDARGRVVPTPLVPLFEAGRVRLNKWRRLLKELTDDVSEASGEAWGGWMSEVVKTIDIDAKKVSEDLGSAVPWVVCPWVAADGTHTAAVQRDRNGVCRVCKDRLFFGRHQWHQSGDDVKRLCDAFRCETAGSTSAVTQADEPGPVQAA